MVFAVGIWLKNGNARILRSLEFRVLSQQPLGTGRSMWPILPLKTTLRPFEEDAPH